MRGLSANPRQPARERCSSPGRGRGAAARRATVDLSPQAVEEVAARIAALLRDRGNEKAPDLLSAGELARRLRVERPWVYRNRALLGGLRIGAGPKAPWRFEYGRAVEALRGLREEQGGEGDRQ